MPSSVSVLFNPNYLFKLQTWPVVFILPSFKWSSLLLLWNGLVTVWQGFFCKPNAEGRLCSLRDRCFYLSIYLFSLAPHQYHLHTCRSIIMPCTTAFDNMYSFLLNSLSNALIVVYVHWSRNHICSPVIRPLWHLSLSLSLPFPLSLSLVWLEAKAGCCRISQCSTTCILSWHLNTKQRPQYRGKAAHPSIRLMLSLP